MKRHLIILVLLFAGLTSGRAADNKNVVAERSQEHPSAEEDSLRLVRLSKLAEDADADPGIRSQRLEELLREAERQGNKRYIGRAYLRYIFQAFNEQDGEKVKEWMGKLEPLARQEGYYDLLFDAQQCVIEILTLEQEFELAEQKSEQMLAEAQQLNHTDGIVAAYKCLAGAYRSTYRIKESAQTLEKAYKLAPKITNPRSRLELLTYLIAIYRHMGDYPNWMKYLDLKEKEIHSIMRKSGETAYYRGDLMMIYLGYLWYYVETGQKANAEHYKRLAEKYKCDDYAVYRFNYARGLADYYQFAGQWEQALEYRDTQCEILESLSYRDYPYALASKAYILYRMGREKEASDTAKEVLRVKDSVQVSILSKQIEQLKTDYRSNQALLEQARIHRYFQYSVLGVVVILLLIFSYFAYRLYYIRTHLARSEKEIRRVAEEVQKATKAKECFLTNMSYAVQTPLKEVVNNSLFLASQQKIGDEERAEVARTILDTSSELMNLVEEILDLARLEAGRMRFSVSDIEVHTLIIDAARASGTTGAEVVSKVPESKRLWVRIDGNRLMQVLGNLLSVPEKGKDIRVELAEESENILSVRIVHTGFAAPDPPQDIIIRNEINRMIIEHFGGDYEIVPQAVRFTLKIRTDIPADK